MRELINAINKSLSIETVSNIIVMLLNRDYVEFKLFYIVREVERVHIISLVY